MKPMEDELQLRIHGEASLPTLIYLPGLHGDWTLVSSFRKHIFGKVRFVEMTYPRTLVWSLGDYAAAIAEALAQKGIVSGWLLGESFGSQILWTMLDRKKFKADGVILAGGFVRHPMKWAVRLVERTFGNLSLRTITWMIFTYAKIAKFRYRKSPETLRTLDDFVGRRTKLDLQAAQHRLHLMAENDLRDFARHTTIPVYAITGFFDPIVPWPFVRRWLRKNCSALRDYKIIHRGDHMVCGTAPRQAARQVLEWMNGPQQMAEDSIRLF